MAIIKNIILDWSGTVADDFAAVFEATNAVFKRYEKPVMSKQEFREKFFLPFPDFHKLYGPDISAEELHPFYDEAFALLQDKIKLLPASLDFLEYCREEKFLLFLLSSIHPDHFEAQSSRLKVKHFFRQIYAGALDKRKTIYHLLAENNLNSDETLFIGDMVHDIETAHHAGVMSCAVLTGYDSLEKLRAASPDLLFRDIGQVRGYLERHRKEPERPPIAAVGALIFNMENEVLMIQTRKWSNLWGIPGGKIKANEPAEAALRREVKEETGLDLMEVEFAMTEDCIDSAEFYKKAHFVLLNYIARCEKKEVTLNDEAENWKWCSLEEALKLSLNTPSRKLIEYVMGVTDIETITVKRKN